MMPPSIAAFSFQPPRHYILRPPFTPPPLILMFSADYFDALRRRAKRQFRFDYERAYAVLPFHATPHFFLLQLIIFIFMPPHYADFLLRHIFDYAHFDADPTFLSFSRRPFSRRHRY
jgi:hypothetical protein